MSVVRNLAGDIDVYSSNVPLTSSVPVLVNLEVKVGIDYPKIVSMLLAVLLNTVYALLTEFAAQTKPTRLPTYMLPPTPIPPVLTIAPVTFDVDAVPLVPTMFPDAIIVLDVVTVAPVNVAPVLPIVPAFKVDAIIVPLDVTAPTASEVNVPTDVILV